MSSVGLLISYRFDGNPSMVVGLLWPALVGAGVFIPAWLRLRYDEERIRALPSWSLYQFPPDVPTKNSVWTRTVALFFVVFSFSIVPMLAWQNYFRVQLSTGLAAHLQQVAADNLRDKIADFRDHTKQLTYAEGGRACDRFLVSDRSAGRRATRHGWVRRTQNAFTKDLSYIHRDGRCLCGKDDRRLMEFLESGVVGFSVNFVRQAICRGEEQSDRGNRRRGWFFGTVARLFAYSPVTWQATWYRSGEWGPGYVLSISDAIRSVVGRTGPNTGDNDGADDKGPARGADGSLTSEVRRWLVVLFGVAFVMFLCYSAVRMKFGYTRCVVSPRPLSLEEVTKDGLPKRLQLIKRSEKEVEQLIGVLSRYFSVKCFRRDGSNKYCWEDYTVGGRRPILRSAGPKSVVFLVEDFRGATAGADAHDVAEELRKRGGEGTLVICSDVVALYHMRPGTVEGRDDMQPAWTQEWRELMRSFEVRVLYGKVRKTIDPKWSNVEVVNGVLGPELRANADFEGVVEEISTRLGKVDDLPASRLREMALRGFRAAAQPRFKTLWAVSSFDERAQLYALAHGGSPNMRRPAAISSLVNRGLITSEDPMKLCSEAFGQFIVEDVDDSLDDWCRKGHGDWWRVMWLPLVLFAGLGLLFFINSNPEAIGVIAAIGAAFIGLVPVVTSLLRVGQVVQPEVSSRDD